MGQVSIIRSLLLIRKKPSKSSPTSCPYKYFYVVFIITKFALVFTVYHEDEDDERIVRNEDMKKQGFPPFYGTLTQDEGSFVDEVGTYP